jgi:outer membrane protein TolC
MRLLFVLFWLTPLILSAGQTLPVKKITLPEAIDLAIRNNPSGQSESGKKLLITDVEKTYFQLVYLQNRSALLQQQVFLMHDLERVADLRFEAGDIDMVERNNLISRLAKVRTAVSGIHDELAISVNKLKMLLLSADDLTPADSALAMYALQKRNEQVPEPGSAAGFTREEEQENLVSALNNYFRYLQYFSQTALEQADKILSVNRIRYEKEDIDYTEFAQHAEEAYNIRLQYLETLNNYNQTAIQLEFYAY